ncbi:MAG TPA: metallophosphoesterase [Actinomycetota bacterium]|nr:metallophosphoesterase [Actinomycetota bacterium]
MVTIAHISDPHLGSPYFVPNLMNRVIAELNELSPDAVVVSGDLTTEGYRPEYKAWLAYVERIEAPLLTVPGNHDSRNVGYVHFEDLIGPRMWSEDIGGVRIVGIDSSEPDLNEGRIGRVHYPWIKQEFQDDAALKVFVMHHHLLPIPGTGRERSTVMDAGDVLEVLIHAGVDVVLSGHKHVPYVWRLEEMFIANAGTVSSMRVRGHGKPCYNVLEFDDGQVRIVRRFPFEAEAHLMASFQVASAKQQREVPLEGAAERS